MKQLIMLIAMSSILASCSQATTRFSRKEAVETLTFKANLLRLSSEDLQILSVHCPKTLGKIMKCDSITLEELIKLHEVGLTPDSLVLILEHTKSRCNLTTSDVIRLQMEGIPFKVINYLIKS